MTRCRQRLFFIGGALVALVMNTAAPDAVLRAAQGSVPAFNALSIPASQQPHRNIPAPLATPLAPPEPSLELPSLKMRTQPGYEQVTVTVTDSSGKYVTDLKADDFRVLEDGQQRPIGFFRIDRSAPVSVGIIVDCSTSMATKFSQARAAITRLVDDLDPRDDVFLESFSIHAQLLQPFTLDHHQIIDHLEFLHAVKSTSLYDAVFMGLYEMRYAQRDKRALLVVTDGLDNTSKTRWEQVIFAARVMKVLIYAVGIGEDVVSTRDNPWWEMVKPDAAEVDMHALKDLADETGGRAYNLRRVGEGEELSRDCAEISDELRRQYTIAYLSPDPDRIGFRPLRVDIPKHPELSVRVRKDVAILPE